MSKMSSDFRWIARQCTETFSWGGIAWFVALGLGLWGAMISRWDFVPSYFVLGICAILCALKWAYETEIDTQQRRVWAFIFGMIILLLLTAGFALWTRSRQVVADETQKDLESLQQIPDLQAKMDKIKQSDYEMKKRVDEFGPKVDAMANQLSSPEQKALALALRKKFMPQIEVDEPSLGDRNSFDFQLVAGMENIGGSTAKGVIVISNMVIAVKSSRSEKTLFDYLHDHALDSVIKPLDMEPGYANRASIPIASHPRAMRLDMIHRMNRDEVVYIGILVTFFDSQGKQHYTEGCFYFDNESRHVDHLCDGHNNSE